MLSQIKNKEIKILVMVGLFIAFGYTGLFGLAFLGGCVFGNMLSDIIFK